MKTDARPQREGGRKLFWFSHSWSKEAPKGGTDFEPEGNVGLPRESVNGVAENGGGKGGGNKEKIKKPRTPFARSTSGSEARWIDKYEPEALGRRWGHPFRNKSTGSFCQSPTTMKGVERERRNKATCSRMVRLRSERPSPVCKYKVMIVTVTLCNLR